MDLKNEAMAVGEPMINYIKNIWQEHICHLVNDEFLNILFQIKETFKSNNYLDMMKEINEGFISQIEKASPLLKPYLKHLCTAIKAWNTSLS